jgi:LPXTG-site transpeptidase (sortase) family protein
MNPLFPDDPKNDKPELAGFALSQKTTNLQPLHTSETLGADTAADVIREKLASIYAAEPNAKQEAAESEAIRPRSKHQEFMHTLSTSGKSLAEIQTQWHNYYVALPDNEKHQVWQEFYENNERSKTGQAHQKQQPAPAERSNPDSHTPSGIVIADHIPKPNRAVKQPRRKLRPQDLRDPEQIKTAILHHVSAGGKLTGKHHVQSLLFGIASGLIVVVIFLFSFFNEVIIAPFIQPNRTASATPIIVDPSSVTVGSTPQIIIPKINVQIPVDYGQTTTNEASIENGLENGIVHYPTTEKPGENGNAAFFGHSSNNIFNKGKYKFAFVLLQELVPGDTFYITNNGKIYIYKVISKTVVAPTEVGVLDNVPGKVATATLITCDPPGTSLHRLVVVGEQISPDPTSNSAGSNSSTIPSSTAQKLPGNGPTLWTRMWRSVF